MNHSAAQVQPRHKHVLLEVFSAERRKICQLAINFPSHSHTHTRTHMAQISRDYLRSSCQVDAWEGKEHSFINLQALLSPPERNLARSRGKFHMWFLFCAPHRRWSALDISPTKQTYFLVSRSRLRKILWQKHLKLSSAKRFSSDTTRARVPTYLHLFWFVICSVSCEGFSIMNWVCRFKNFW